MVKPPATILPSPRRGLLSRALAWRAPRATSPGHARVSSPWSVLSPRPLSRCPIPHRPPRVLPTPWRWPSAPIRLLQRRAPAADAKTINAGVVEQKINISGRQAIGVRRRTVEFFKVAPVTHSRGILGGGLRFASRWR